jgi:hypothetical protein
MPPEEEATARGIQLILHKEAPKRNTLLAEVNNIKEETWQFKNARKMRGHRINVQLTNMTKNTEA